MESQLIYNKIIFYYDIIEKIKQEILKLNELGDSVKFEVLMPAADNIKAMVDTLMEKYVLFSKDETNNALKREILDILNKILEMVYNYKNIVYNLYKDL